ncbi:Ser/Thr protein kinase RdoA (MazF antagonist) [Catenulispora sp. EB89]|uniref:phosphotransferase enzyme family protein n=1 Tax=Catenulispora sp. EB89 TaxID=3156257 RepID=UPI0035168A10
METEGESSDAYTEVFDRFGIQAADIPDRSCYVYSPVFRTVVGGRQAAVKRTRRPIGAADALASWLGELSRRGVRVVQPLPVPNNPAAVGDRCWVAYPWISGTPYDGSAEHIALAGDLLGRMHAAAGGPEEIPRFTWPDHDQASVDEDVEGLTAVFKRHAPELLDHVLPRLSSWLQDFMAETLPPIRDAGLPVVVASMDFRANNLVYTPDGPILIDPDNAETAARILDLALAVLLFHNEAEGAPSRLFDVKEWAVFRDAYVQHVELTPDERRLWPVALRYMLLEWCVWSLIAAEEWGDWERPQQRDFLTALADADLGAYEL